MKFIAAFLSLICVTCATQFCDKRFNAKLKTLDLVNSQVNYLWSQLDDEISNAQNEVLKARNKVNGNNIALIDIVIIGNILKIAGRNLGDTNLEISDAFDIAGRSFYSIGFMTGRANQIDLTPLDCGYETYWTIDRKFNLRQKLNIFQERALSSTLTQHPLETLGSDYHPEVLKNQVDQFKLRAEISLSCLFENGQGQGLKGILDMLTETMKRQIDILNAVIKDKISDIGQSLLNHNCLNSKI